METNKINISAFWSIIVLTLLFLIPQDMFSQGPPPWAPAHGYRAKTKHVYFPDQNFYYDVEKRNYLYLQNGKWNVSVQLPSIYANINLGGSTQIQLEIGGHTPYTYNKEHLIKYKKPKKSHKYKEKGHKH
jgi:hypothetical protein